MDSLFDAMPSSEYATSGEPTQTMRDIIYDNEEDDVFGIVEYDDIVDYGDDDEDDEVFTRPKW
jgi:hypothetical protein